MGNALGANDPWMARCSACCVLCAHPFFWGAGLIIILLPSTRRLVLATFTQGQDEVSLPSSAADSSAAARRSWWQPTSYHGPSLQLLYGPW